jgi:integrase
VTPAGGKLWRWKYRFEGTQKTASFGKYPEVSLEMARDRHHEARKLLASGTDPMALRKSERRASNPFQSIAYLWLEHWSLNKSPRHVGMTRRRLEKNTLPLLGHRPIDAIQAPELVAMVKAIEARGVGDLARRSLETCGQIFRYAIAHGYATRNPCADIKPADVLRPTTKNNLARVDARELPALLKAIEVYRGSVVTRLAMKLMALTFVRTSELIGARWEEFDFAEDAKFSQFGATAFPRWNIPKERMKMKSPHIVPLSTQALEVLELLRAVTGNYELLFPGERDSRRPMSNMSLLMALRRMGYQGRHTGHGFRGLASTLLHEQGWNHDWIELQLAHTQRNAVSAAYNHALYLEPRAKMMQAWADYLERTQRSATVTA